MHCSVLCLCPVQIMQPDPRVFRLVEELSNSLRREAELPEEDQIPAVLVLNKVCCDSWTEAKPSMSFPRCEGFQRSCTAARCILHPGLQTGVLQCTLCRKHAQCVLSTGRGS